MFYTPMNNKIETEMKNVSHMENKCNDIPSLNINNNNKTEYGGNNTVNDLKKLIKNNNRDKITKQKPKNNITLNIKNNNNPLILNKVSKIKRKRVFPNKECLPQDNGKFPLAYSSHLPNVGFPYFVETNSNNKSNNDSKMASKKRKKNKSKCLWICKYELKKELYCDKSFMQKCHWMRHCLEKHTTKEFSQRFECPFCSMKYAQNSSLKEHIAIYHSDTPPKFICPYCKLTNNNNITFTRWTSVLRHVRKQHPNMKEPNKKDQKQISIDSIVSQLFKKIQ